MQMNRRSFLSLCGKATVGSLAAASLSRLAFAEPPDGRKPNIVFIFADDLGWRDVGFMGSKFYETPNIDKLARQGMIFTEAYAAAPNCTPSRACLMTGQYTPRHGVYSVSGGHGYDNLRKLLPIPSKKLDADAITIAEALKPAGYVCANIGKWQLGDDPTLGPIGQGFDVNVAGSSAGAPKSYFSPYRMKGLKDGPEGEYLTDRLTDEALKFMEANKDKPFFLYLSHYSPHTPWEAKEDTIAKYKDKKPDGNQRDSRYAAMIEHIDDGVGRIMKQLDDLDLTNSTMVVFFSDNGGMGSNEPLRGAKHMLYEGGIREPMIVRWPGVVKPGSSCDVPVIAVDFYPTFLEIAGAGKPANHILDGESLTALLKGGSSLKRKAIFWHFPAYIGAPGPGGRDPHFRARPCGVIRMGDWKLIEHFEDGHLELYNVKQDIGEDKNLAKEVADKTKELHQALRAWRKSINAPVPTELNPTYDPKAKPAT